MIVLGIETSTDVGSVAVCAEGRTLASYAFPEGARHARNIMPAVDDVLGRAGVAKDAVEAVAVSAGPGSFNGLRVGLTCAKALAFALGWQCVAVPSLEVSAGNLAAEEGAVACPVRDARRARVYGTVFERREGRWHDTTDVLLKPPHELADMLPEGAVVFGTGVAAYPEAFRRDRFHVESPGLEVGHAETVARLGLERLRAGAGCDPMQLVPRYYRLTQAEEVFGAAHVRPFPR